MIDRLNKIISIVLLFSIVIISFSVVSAADYSDIRTQTDSASNGTVINLGSNTYNTDGSTIRIENKKINITGSSNSNRAIIDGKDISGAFYIDANSTVSLKYINFVGASNPSFHAITAYGTVFIENCTFSSCNGDSGSAICLLNSSKGSIINNSRFINNRADNDGANNYAAGGAICVSGADNVQILNSYFSGNAALNAGGAIVLRDDALNTKIIGCEFVNNFVNDGYGGAIYNQKGTGTVISNCIFTNNKAPTNRGGAIFSIYELTISGSTFTGNSAKNGGAIYSTSTLAILSSKFSNNKASSNGGAIYSTNSMNITGGTISGNTATYGSGVYNSGTLRMNNITVSSNYADVLRISLNSPNSVTKGDKLVIQSSVVTGDNLLNSIYSENSNVFRNGVSLTSFNNAQGKTISLLINNKKYTAITSSKGIATFTIQISSKTTSSSAKIEASFKQKGVTFKTMKIVSYKSMKGKVDALNKTIIRNKFVSSKKDKDYLIKQVKNLNKTIKKIKKSNLSNANKKKLQSRLNTLLKVAKKAQIIKVKTISKAKANEFKKGSSVTSYYNYMEARVYENAAENDNRKWIKVSNSATVDQYPLGLRKVTVKTVKTSTGKYVDYVKKTSTTTNSDKTVTTVNESFVVKGVKGKNNKFLLSNKTTITNTYSYLGSKYLQPSTKCESNDPKIKNLANNMLINYTKQRNKKFNIPEGFNIPLSTWEKSDAIYLWVCNNVDYVSNANYSALGVLNDSHKNAKGKYIANCVGYSNLITALLRSIDIPVKYHSALYFEKENYPFSNPHSAHVWAEIYLNQWVVADGAFFYDDINNTFSNYIVGFHNNDASHIAFNYTHDNKRELWEFNCNHYLNSSHKDSNILLLEKPTGTIREPHVFIVNESPVLSGMQAVNIINTKFTKVLNENYNMIINGTFAQTYDVDIFNQSNLITVWYVHIHQIIKVGNTELVGSFLGYFALDEKGILRSFVNTTSYYANGTFFM